MQTRVKICGITRIEDVEAAVRAGADAIGLVFDPASPRCVDLERARAIVQAVPPFVMVVGLFVDAEPERVQEVLNGVRLDLLQFHGAESPEQCRRYARRYIKAVRMRPQLDVVSEARRYADAAGILLDSFVPGVSGGSGRSFDWSRAPRDLGRPLILAGGLTAQNVSDAIRRVRPYAVDVSSGVERSPGVKDPGKIAAFLEAVRNVV